MEAREQAIIRAKHVNAPEDAHVESLCEAYGYGAVMDAAARLWARKDSRGAFFIASECLGCADLTEEAAALRRKHMIELQTMGQEWDRGEEQ